MSSPRCIVAIEIGSSKIKGAVGTVDPVSDDLSVIAIEEVHQHPNYVRYGCVQNVKEVANELNTVISHLNAKIAPRRISAVYMGVGGRSLMATPANLEYTMSEETEVTHEIVEELMSHVDTSSSDREILDVVRGEFFVDSKSQGTDPVGTIGRKISAAVSVISCRQQVIRNLSLAVSEKLGLHINGNVVRPTAIADMVLTSDERRLGTVLVDFGAETTTVVIYKGGVLNYLATLPLGSRHISRDITALSYTEDRAEELKRTLGNANPADTTQNFKAEGIDSTEINCYVAARAGEIVVNIAEQLSLAKLTAADLPGGIVLVGGGAMLHGFADVLADFTNMRVRYGTPPSNVRLLGSKMRGTDDVDVVALLYKLSHEATQSCIELPAAKPVEPPTPEPDEPEQEPEEEEIEERKGGFMSKLRNFFSPNPDEMDVFED
jgi:cell division protein FtsA